MRIRDLVPGVEYATCDGQLVTCNTPVGKWTRAVKRNDKGELVRNEKTRDYEYEYVSYNPDEVDPWGGCMDIKKPSQIGVYVTYWKTDRDGKKTTSYGVGLVRPADIKGLWKEFLVLHGEKVRKKWDDAEDERVRKEKDKSLTRRMKAIGIPAYITSSKWRDSETIYLYWDVEAKDRKKIEKLVATLEKKLTGVSQS